MTGVLRKRGKFWIQRQIGTQGDAHVKSGGMLPQAKEPPEAGREVRTFLGAFRGSTALPTH